MRLGICFGLGSGLALPPDWHDSQLLSSSVINYHNIQIQINLNNLPLKFQLQTSGEVSW